MSKRVSFHTFGCRLNQAETASIRSSFKNYGYHVVDGNELSDLVVINTCTVTKNGDNDTRRLVSRIIKENPKVQIALIGCQAQTQANKLSQMPNIRWVIGNARKMELISIVEEESAAPFPTVSIESIPQGAFRIPYSGTEQGLTRANLKIQDGCDFYCFFA